jgi:hypothetical protein
MADTEQQYAVIEDQPSNAEALASVKQETLDQLPAFIPDDDREALAEAKAKMEVEGSEPTEAYFELLDRSANAVEAGYRDVYENAGVEASEPAAIGQRKQFLAQPLSEDEAVAIAAAEETVEAKKKDYGRTINGLKEQYRQDLGGAGDPKLTDAAAQIRASEQVYGTEPSEKQSKLLQAADIQRQKGVGRQLQQDYEASGVPASLASAAGDIKAQQYIGGELSESQETRLKQADSYLSRPEGQLKRAQQQNFLAGQAKSAYQEGRTAQALEDAGVEPDLASRVAKIEVSTGGEPESPEDAALIEAAYAGADGVASPRDEAIAANAEAFMDAAQSAGLTATVGRTQVAEGNNYTLTRASGVTVIENQETGGSLASRGGDVLSADGMTEADQDRFETLGQVSTEDLKKAAQRQAQPQASQEVALG